MKTILNVKMSKDKVLISTSLAPQPIGPYSQALRIESNRSIIYLSGQIGINARTGQLVGDSIIEQMEQIFNNIKAIVESGGSLLSDIIKLTLYLTDIDDLSVCNTIMKQFFHPPYPVRTTVAVKELPMRAKIEIEAIVLMRN